MTWSDVAVAAAFAIGAVAGGVGAILVMRYLLTYLRRDRQE